MRERLKGWRVVTFNVLSIILIALASDTSWLDSVPPRYLVYATLLVNIANIALRYVTTTPIGQRHPEAGNIT